MYDQSCDIWGLGCTFLELFSCHESIKIPAEDRSPFLMGSSCYPLSPAIKDPLDTTVVNDD